MKHVFLSLCSLLMLCLSSVTAQAWDSHRVTFINKTKNSLGIITQNRPFTRSDVSNLPLTWLEPDEQITLKPHGRVVGYYQRGVGTDYTILLEYDRALAFVEHKGEIKTLHGEVRETKLTNSKDIPLIFETTNPHKGEEDCKDCVEECYYKRGNTIRCPCLDWCWDKTQDMSWYLDPFRNKKVLLAAGTKLGIFETQDTYNDYTCEDEDCWEIAFRKVSY